MEGIKNPPEDWSVGDIEEELRGSDPELLRLMHELPRSLWGRHFRALENIRAGSEEDDIGQLRREYLLGVLAAREHAIVEFESKDAGFRSGSFVSGERTEAFQLQLRELLASREHILGSGRTARVKSLQVDDFEKPIAVKYLITPTEKTLSVQGEHDMLYEVEIVANIEKNEEQAGAGAYIRVPHPYFYYKRGSVQCYGMSQVEGVRLDHVMSHDGSYNPLRDAVIRALRERFASSAERSALEEEIKPFMQAVHKVCLHGDINPKNIMVDTKGVFYLIDFGQSVSARAETEEAREQFDNLRELEPGLMRECIVATLNYVRENKLSNAA